MYNENPVTETVNSSAFLDRLRAATSSAHRELEQIPISAALLQPTLTDAVYFEYLSLMRDIVADAEQHIFTPLHNYIPDAQKRLKTQWLDHDLAFGNIKLQIQEFPLSATGPFQDGFAMGIFYVIEGSTLGGRFILRNVQETLGRNHENGAAYFYGYGNQTGSYWKNFLESLTQYAADFDQQEAIIDGAVFAFQAIHQHFAKTAQPA
jgi:heme oxygenase (biliverdin-IX-beta and delta-forming)